MDAIEYNRIDDYLLGRLEGDGLTAFEQQLQTDMEFAKRVNQQKNALDLLRKVGDFEMKKEVQEVQDLFEKGKQSKSLLIVLRPWLVAAASIALLVFAYVAFQVPTAEQLFNSNYLAYDTGYGNRAGTDPVEMKLAEASKYYKEQKYAEALPIFESAQSEIKEAKLLLMTGITYLELNQFDKAQASFSQLVTQKDPAFQYHGLWYSAMSYLKAGDIEKAKNQLQQLVNAEDENDVFKQLEAMKILKKL